MNWCLGLFLCPCERGNEGNRGREFQSYCASTCWWWWVFSTRKVPGVSNRKHTADLFPSGGIVFVSLPTERTMKLHTAKGKKGQAPAKRRRTEGVSVTAQIFLLCCNCYSQSRREEVDCSNSHKQCGCALLRRSGTCTTFGGLR